MSAIEDRLKFPVKTTVELVRIVSLKCLFFWTATAGRAGVWETELTGDVTGVFEEDAALEEAADVDGVEATPLSFFHDRAAGLLYVRPNAADPRETVFTVELENRVGTVAKVHEGKPYAAKFAGGPVVKMIEALEFGEFQKGASGELRLDDSDGRLSGLNEGVPVRVTFKLGVDL